MSRRSRAEVRETPNDPRFASRTVTKFINSMMRDGKKSIAEKIFYDAIELMERHHALSESLGRAADYAAAARGALACFPPSPAKAALLDLVDFCVERAY